ncbi:unnamed protein product [Rhizophagus irregularis]|nr:unnamed protein product [Rhizophagus irregularis]
MRKAELIDSEDSEKLLLITGIEAAAIDCMNTIKEKSKYFLVVNCGDGLVELTLRKIVNNKLVEKSLSSRSLGKSRYLRTSIEQEFQQHIIIVPRQPLATVVSGALEYGLNMDSIHSRVIDMTYGVGILHPWKEDNSNERQFFNRLVSKGTEVHVNQEFEFKLDYKDQTKFYIELYSTSAQDAIFCDEPGVSKVGTIGIEIPESWDNFQSVNLVLFLGQIEIHPFIKNEKEEFSRVNFKVTLV